MCAGSLTGLVLICTCCFAGSDPAAPGDGDKPVPLKESLDRFKTAISQQMDAEVAFDLTLGDSLPVLRFNQPPSSITVTDKDVVDYTRIGGKAATLLPKAAGTTAIALKFGDKAKPAAQWVVNLRIKVRAAPKEDAEKAISNKESLEVLGKVLGKREDADVRLSLSPGQRLPLTLSEVPFTIQVADSEIVDYSHGMPASLTLEAKKPGRTPLLLWFGDRNNSAKQFVITLKVRVQSHK